MKKHGLRFLHDFATSETFGRGQAAVGTMFFRAMFDAAGFWMFYVGSWHPHATHYPPDVQALLESD